MMSYEVRLEVFEGPFQLLLSLIIDKRLDVCDIPIAQLTNDYLAHLSSMQEMDLEVTTEFLVVAASLLQLKARALVPVGSDEASLDEDIERDLLVSRLLEIRTFQEAGGHLSDLIRLGDDFYPSAPASDDPAVRSLPVLADIDATILGRCLCEVIAESIRTVDVSLLVGEGISSEQASAELNTWIERGSFSFRELVDGRSVGWAVALFLAILEFGARGEIQLAQMQRLGDIVVTAA